MQGSKGPFYFEVVMQIKYVKMPISIEEKKEFNKQGFKVVDVKFSPEPVQEEKPKPKRKPRAKKV